MGQNSVSHITRTAVYLCYERLEAMHRWVEQSPISVSAEPADTVDARLKSEAKKGETTFSACKFDRFELVVAKKK